MIFTILAPLKNKKVNGVTTIELIVTISILTILLSLILLNTKSIENRQINLDLKIIEREIISTRNISITSRNRNHIEFLEDSYYTTYDSQFKKLEKLRFNRIHPLCNTNIFSFTELGRPTNTGAGTLIFTYKDKIFKFSLTPAVGKVNLEEISKWKLKDLFY